MTIKKITALIFGLGLTMLTIGALPSAAKPTPIEIGITKSHFFDTEKTIIMDISPDTTIKTLKYWEKNLFYSSKYKPLFMLSNKELFDLMPKENISVTQRIMTPSVYNISLKSSSVKKIVLNPPTVQKKQEPKQTAKQIAKKTTPNSGLAYVYEQAKNPDAEPEAKIEAALTLKSSNKSSDRLLSIDLLDDVTRKEPYNAYAFYLKGELYAMQRDIPNAMKNYIEALKINPTSKQSCIGIAKILEPTNKQLAQRYYERASMSEE